MQHLPGLLAPNDKENVLSFSYIPVFETQLDIVPAPPVTAPGKVSKPCAEKPQPRQNNEKQVRKEKRPKGQLKDAKNTGTVVKNYYCIR